ncbi:PEPTIDE-N4-(N-ACETYL-BETA-GLUCOSAMINYL)ASPARAGINE AMIDASE A PROTEIN [Salix purpurea]|uniref:PEPTIDE-N4-(N-ACETYL-BETA-GLUCOSAMINYL)ASPARAGINE AMIDASE A PROTEIN n=1 Tax=Salix purpurea TaxID=77065 RepID=A0A9Q0UBE5_SALPP|nr:PEPTIDE-N4-(N-ACETYL-BETA-GLUCOSAMINYL)ASPARAGINE AMIDASE A PROTEIN [Salix purpurea]
MHPFPALFLLLFLTTCPPLTRSTSPDHLSKPSSPPLSSSHKPKPKPKSKEYFELTHPLPSDRLTPSCKLHIIQHSFADTVNQPPYSTPYFPPFHCPPPWSHVTLEFHVKSKGYQHDRISALWLGGSELLRTSTAEPGQRGIFWKVRKDITRYSSLLQQNYLNFTVMLENNVNDIYTGVYHAEVTLYFYADNAIKVPFTGKNQNLIAPALQLPFFGDKSMYDPPADLIIPISASDSTKGYWFIVEGDLDVKYEKVRFPLNTRKVVLELYVSFHGTDEFWYTNPSNSYIRINNSSNPRGNGAFREVYVSIDGKLVGSEMPFPVIFTGGINPLLWKPVVAIGAFNLPSYDFDLTPFLGMVLDDKDHVFSIGVTDGIKYWLVDANLHIWLDSSSTIVEAKNVVNIYPESEISRSEEFQSLDGSFGIKAEKFTRLEGWVKSSSGNLTTSILQEVKFTSTIKFKRKGTYKTFKQNIEVRREAKVLNDVGGLVSRVIVKRKYPLKVITVTLPGSKNDTCVLVTNVTHAVNERIKNGKLSSHVINKQVSNGWMEVRDHSVLSGEAMTNQTYVCRDELGCYVRTVATLNGRLIKDNTAYACPSLV